MVFHQRGSELRVISLNDGETERHLSVGEKERKWLPRRDGRRVLAVDKQNTHRGVPIRERNACRMRTCGTAARGSADPPCRTGWTARTVPTAR